MIRNQLFPSACVVAFFSSILAAMAFSLSSITPLELQEDIVNINEATTIEIIEKLSKSHFVQLTINDQLSERFLDNYLERLDPDKVFFYQSDIDEFASYRHSLDELLLKGDNTVGLKIYHRFQKRLVERLEAVIEKLEIEKHDTDFTVDEFIETDREKSDWFVSQKEADDYWRKRIKSFFLAQKISDEPLEKTRETLLKRYKNRLARIEKNTDEDVYEIYINAFSELYDPHTNYLAPRTSENFNINMSLSLEGIGAVLQTEDEYTKVVRLVTGGPAQKQGDLKPTDLITGVAQGENGDMVDVVGWRLDEVVDLIRGPKDTIVRLQVESEAEDMSQRIINIQRDKVKLEDQAAQKAVIELADETSDTSFKIGIIKIPGFYIDFQAYRERDPNYRSTTRDVYRMLNELERENVDGIVIDLRGNGGGSLQEATTLTDLFIDRGPVVQIGHGKQNTTARSRFRAHYRGPLAVIINRLSASASEIFAGAIQDYNRGIILGSQSFGKGTVQTLTPLKTKGDLKITESKFYRVSGESTQHRGVIPDIKFPELLDTDLIGESSYDTALAWSKTHATQYGQYYAISDFLPELQNHHNKRIISNPDFLYFNEQKLLIESLKEKTLVSLNESVRLKEKEELEQRRLDIENRRRVAKNKKPFKNFNSYKSFSDKKDEEAQQKAGTTVIDTEDDAILTEASMILQDFTNTLNNNDHKLVKLTE